jgi:HPt (histidine-containing phosphotransfer) domain-containing protein
MQPDLLDQAALDTLLATTDREFVGELIDAYLEDSPSLIAGMQQALVDGNATEFTRAAHSLKSSSASLGAASLSDLAKELENLGRESKLPGAASKLEQLAGLFEQVQTALEEFKRGS